MARRWQKAPRPDEPIEEYWKRMVREHVCLFCGKPSNRMPAVGPIEVSLKDPERPDGVRHEFCCWECLAKSFAEWASGEFVSYKEKYGPR